MLVIFPTVRWIQMTPSTVCFGARDDSYGFFRTAKAGNIITFKLTHKSGYVTCHSSNPSYQSKWGCLWNRLIPNQMATLITDKNRNLLLPKSDFLSDYWGCKFYSLPWAGLSGDFIVKNILNHRLYTLQIFKFGVVVNFNALFNCYAVKLSVAA